VARRPPSFFASPKKEGKERRPHSRCPSGSRLCKSKNGKRTKLACGSDSVHFFFHFLLSTNGSVTAEERLVRLAFGIAEPKPGVAIIEISWFQTAKSYRAERWR